MQVRTFMHFETRSNSFEKYTILLLFEKYKLYNILLVPYWFVKLEGLKLFARFSLSVPLVHFQIGPQNEEMKLKVYNKSSS
jgi:hypothetical protein